jgi:peptidoglycan/LPS O-acetylase OafA/YrhL
VSLENKFRNFWMRRVLRIFPLYYLYLLILIIVWLFVGAALFGRQLPYLLTYTYNLTWLNGHWMADYPVVHLWSLSVEEQFYLFYPFIVLLCSARQLKWAAVILIIAAICFRFVYNEYAAPPQYFLGKAENTMHALTLTHLDAFLAGGSIVIFNLANWPVKRIQAVFYSFLFFTIIAGLVMYLHSRNNVFHFNDYITDLGLNPDYDRLYNRIWIYLPVAGLFASVILILVTDVKSGIGWVAARVFGFRPLVGLGKLSYGIYIIHLAVLWLLPGDWIVANKYLFFIPYVILLYSIELMLYRLVEKRCLDWKEKFR